MAAIEILDNLTEKRRYILFSFGLISLLFPQKKKKKKKRGANVKEGLQGLLFLTE